MHWSFPAAIRCLTAMRRTGWRATSWQIARATRSVAAHTDLAAARALLRELGADGDPLPCTPQGRNDAGRDVHQVTIPTPQDQQETAS